MPRRLSKQLRARRYLQASMERGYTNLPEHERDRLGRLMREHEHAYPGVRQHAIVGARKHFDKPLHAGEREHQAHLRRESRMAPGELEDARTELDRELAGTFARARQSGAGSAAGAAAAGGASAAGAALRGGGSGLMYAVGIGLLLILLYVLLTGSEGPGRLGGLFSGLVGVGTGAARSFIAPVDPIASLESALGAGPIHGGSSASSSSPAPAAPPAGAAGYVAPLVGATRERTDQGVDYSAAPGSAVRAIGAGTITNIYPFYKGQPAIVERLSSGPLKGRSIYYAEQLTPSVRVGARVGAGSTIARVARAGTGLELGWASGSGNPLAQSQGGYTEGHPTAAGESFSAFLKALGI